MIMPNFGT